MRFEATVAGRTVPVEVALRDGRYRVAIDGRALEVDLVRLGRHFHSLLVEGRSHELALERVPGAVCVHFPGEMVRVEIAVPSHATSRAGRDTAGPQRVTAPMPGRIVRVFVEPGAEVQAGQRLLVIEAMKMENELSAPRPGRVVEVPVREGQAVEAGALLFVIA